MSDELLSTFQPRHREPEPLTLLEHLWVLTNPEGRHLRCGLFANPYGVECRIYYGDDGSEIRLTQVLKHAEQAKTWAEDYRLGLLSTGDFTDQGGA
jgi:hypothetical protein